MFTTEILHLDSMVKSKVNSWRILYDCGSKKSAENNLSEIVKKAVQDVGDKFDFAFFSHIDIDHVNGIRHLQDQNVTCQIVFLPLLQPLEALLSVVRSFSDGDEFSLEDEELKLLSDLISTPANTVRELLGTQEVIFIEPGAPIERIEFNPAPNDDDEGDARWARRFSSQPEDTENVSSEIHTKAPLLELTQENKKMWTLAPYVNERTRENQEKFTNTLARHLDIEENEFIEKLKIPGYVFEILKNHDKILRETYKESLKGVSGSCDKSVTNCSSIILYSGPSPLNLNASIWEMHSYQRSLEIRDFSLREREVCWARANQSEKTAITSTCIGFLGTGDSPLKDKQIREEVIEYYKEYSPLIYSMTLPHHGSIKNFDNDLLTKINPQLIIATVNSTPPNTTTQIHHPDSNVVAICSSGGRLFHAVTEEMTARLHIDTTVLSYPSIP